MPWTLKEIAAGAAIAGINAAIAIALVLTWASANEIVRW